MLVVSYEGICHVQDHRIVQPPLLSLLVLTCRATRAASVKASLTPRFFMAEHSVKRRQHQFFLKAHLSYRGIAGP